MPAKKNEIEKTMNFLSGEANGVAKYKQRKYFIMDTRDHDIKL